MEHFPPTHEMVGKRVIVRYEYQAGNYRMVTRVMGARFIGVSLDRDEFVFSGRPLFGTTSLPRHQIRKTIEAGEDAKPFRPRKRQPGDV